MLLRAAQIESMAGQEKVHFLNSSARRLNKALGDAVGLKKIGVHMITVMPGHASTEHHVHRFEEECCYVLSGVGRVVLGDDIFEVSSGDFIGYPVNGPAHHLTNDGTEPLVCLIVGQRLAVDVTDYPRKGKRLYRIDGAWELVNQADIRRVDR